MGITTEGVGREAEYVCSDGTKFPATGMGGQSASRHEDGLTRVRRPAPFSLVFTKGDTNISLFSDTLVIGRTTREPGKTSHWYPLHVSWSRKSPKGRHFTVRRHREYR